MANRRQQPGHRMDYRDNRGGNYGRPGPSPWQGGGPGAGIPNLMPLGGGSTEATLALANNLINNLLQNRQAPMPSLLDMPMPRRDFGLDMGRFHDHGYGPNRMVNQGNFRRTGTYVRPGDRNNHPNNRKSFNRPNDGQRNQPNKSSSRKEPDSKAKPDQESDPAIKQEASDSNEANEESQDPKTRYDNIPSSLLKCHICNKSMWDGRSFENHLNGRAHGIMMQKTAESYALTADTMRQEFKIREMKRTRKAGQKQPRDFYCAMCDMYAADGAAHRTTVGHRKLKKYLHPACTDCHKEMPTRIELDEHRLTPEHLKNVSIQEATTKTKPEVMVVHTLSMEQAYVRDGRRRRATKQSEGADNNAEDGEEHEGTADVEVKKEAEDTETADEQAAPPDNLLVDFKEEDDLSHVTQEMVPVYSTNVGVGRGFLADFSCVHCTLCNKLLDCAETADVHLRTRRHHQLYVQRLRERANLPAPADGLKRGARGADASADTKRRRTDGEAQRGEHGGGDGQGAAEVTDDVEMPLADAEADAPQTDGEADGQADIAEADGQADIAEADGQADIHNEENWDEEQAEQNGTNEDAAMEPEEGQQPEPEPVEEPAKPRTRATRGAAANKTT